LRLQGIAARAHGRRVAVQLLQHLLLLLLLATAVALAAAEAMALTCTATLAAGGVHI
jgi:hypothetical protein